MWSWAVLVGCQAPGAPLEDRDGDGYASPADCDDADAAVNPGAQEVCDSIDNDCDGAVDDLDVLRYRDLDGDGHGDPDISVSGCTAPADYVASGDDCNDSAPTVSPSAEELCDGIDNDCDGVVDPPGVSSDFYRDDDGDGYGVGEAIYACVPPDDHGDRSGDCDDTESRVNPGYPEVCDGLDNDCDAATLEDGTIGWTDGASSDDLTARFAKGTPDAPVLVELRDEGTVSLCGGTWYVVVDVLADVNIVGLGASPSDNILDAGGTAPVLSWPLEPVLSAVSGLTLTNGSGRYDARYSVSVGGGARCQTESTVTLRDVHITGNTAGMGGGVFIDHCAMTITDAVITDNHADEDGGGIANTTGDTLISDSVISHNSAQRGGGVALRGFDRTALTLTDTLITANTATWGGGLSLSDWASVTCTGTGKGPAGLTANRADEDGGGLWLDLIAYGGTLSVDGCDLGVSGSAGDNLPDDVYRADLNETYTDFGSAASFLCDVDGCG